MTRMISRFLRPRRLSRAELCFTVYTRETCCCCHKALDVLKAHQRKHRFTIDEIDVDTDPALAAEHGLSVPVVALNGKVRFRGVVNPVLLQRLLAAERWAR
jgi:glutaredoxin